MNTPAWIKIAGSRRTKHGVEMLFRVRTWHPSFIRLFVREALSVADREGISRWDPRLWCIIVVGAIRLIVRR